MEKKFSKHALWPALLIVMFCATNIWAAADIDTLKARLTAEYIKGAQTGINGDSGEAYLARQQTDGRWPDIDYDAPRIGPLWSPMTHLNRLLAMSVAYKNPAYAAYLSAPMKEGINRGILTWNNRNVPAWYAEMGQQQILGPILVIMDDSLDLSLINKIICIDCWEGLGNKLQDEGTQNYIWYASQWVWRGCVQDSASVVNIGVNAMQTVFYSYGINSELIFYQHGIFYNGGYGRGFMSDMTFWAVMTRGLSFAFGANLMSRLTNLILDANRWMVRRDVWDFAATGREISRNGPKGKGSFGVSPGWMLMVWLPGFISAS